jgi:S1-C subfamily serine protease
MRTRRLQFLTCMLLLGGAACAERAADRVPATVPADPGSFAPVVDAVMPSIVLIEAEARPHGVIGRLLPGIAPEELFPVGVGSGVIYSGDGLIITNNHVVRDADRVRVTLHDRRQFEAQVVARDPSTDIAVVRIPGNGYPAARPGDSDALRLGDRVLALGSPLGLQFTVTAGIISGTGRAPGILGREAGAEPMQASPIEAFIQTDAAISPGNSGGPLVDAHGAIIGINTALVRPETGFSGYGFAIPSNLAWRVADQLVRFGEVRRPYLGVLLDAVTPADAEVYGLDRAEGAEIKFIEPGGPAAEAGLELGDVIVSIEGRAVSSVSDLQSMLAQLEPTTPATLRVVRYGETLDVTVRLGAVRSGIRPDDAAPDASPADGEPADRLGFAAASMDGGVVVTAVRPLSAAARAGVRPGQRIVAVNRRAVRTTAEVVAAAHDALRDVVSLVVDDPRIGRTIINYRM